MENDISLPELLLIDKPKGITSFDVIRILRKQLGIKKIGHATNPPAVDGHALKPPKLGHAGTLDPLATGLLLVGVGAGTKKLHDLVGLPKTYYVEILLGCKTTTGDLDGEVIEEKEVGELKEEVLQSTIQKLIGVLKLPVPIYSAVKRGGVPLYKKARNGEEVIAPVRNMEVFDVRLIKHNKDERYVVVVEMDVASGVYVRSVAEEFGRILDIPATVKELRRTKIGDFDVKDAQKLESLFKNLLS